MSAEDLDQIIKEIMDASGLTREQLVRVKSLIEGISGLIDKEIERGSCTVWMLGPVVHFVVNSIDERMLGFRKKMIVALSRDERESSSLG